MTEKLKNLLTKLEELVAQARAGATTRKPQRTRFSDYAVSLFERKLETGEIDRNSSSAYIYGNVLSKHLVPRWVRR